VAKHDFPPPSNANPAPPEEPSDTEIAETIHEWVERKAREGFDSREEIIETVCEVVKDDYGREDLRPRVVRATDEALAAHYREQTAWERPTDCDRLDAAFAALEERGIVARQNFTCCQSCGHAEIGDEIEEFEEHGTPVGYAFYHMQDTERAAETGTFYIAYGSVEDSPEDAIKVGHAIVEGLREQGLTVRWNGELSERICISGIDWRKYRDEETSAASN
jgi:hypothetical protein